jgi:photosynthetic reaction center M subunit
MAIEYQNIFTQVQVQGEPDWGMDESGEMMADRAGRPRFSTLFGLLGNAQLGPINVSSYGVISCVCFMIWFNIVGLSMLAQVGWSVP